MKTLPLTIKIAKATHDVVKQGHIGRRVEKLLSSATINDVVSALAHRHDSAHDSAPDNALVVPQSLANTTPNAPQTTKLTPTAPVITKVLVAPQALDNFSCITSRTGLSRDYLLDLLLEWDVARVPAP